MHRCEFQVTGRSWKIGEGVEQMQGHRKGALDTSPGKPHRGLEPGRNKGMDVGQRVLMRGTDRSLWLPGWWDWGRKGEGHMLPFCLEHLPGRSWASFKAELKPCPPL